MKYIKRILFIPAFVIVCTPFIPIMVCKGIHYANAYMDKAFGLIDHWQE